MITKKEVEHIAKLSRLGLKEKEIEKFQKELSKILDYIEKLKEVDISGVEPTSHSLAIENIKRRDNPEPLTLEKIKKATGQAPETKEGYFKVKPIL